MSFPNIYIYIYDMYICMYTWVYMYAYVRMYSGVFTRVTSLSSKVMGMPKTPKTAWNNVLTINTLNDDILMRQIKPQEVFNSIMKRSHVLSTHMQDIRDGRFRPILVGASILPIYSP